MLADSTRIPTQTFNTRTVVPDRLIAEGCMAATRCTTPWAVEVAAMAAVVVAMTVMPTEPSGRRVEFDA